MQQTKLQILKRKSLVMMVAWLAAQQCFVGLSTLALASLVTRINSNDPQVSQWYLLTFMAFLMPFPLGALAQISRNYWALDCEKSFYDLSISHNLRSIQQWSHAARRQEKESYISKEGPNAIHNVTHLVYQMLATGLNFLLSTIALCHVTTMSLGLAMLSGVMIALFGLLVQRTFTDKASQELDQKGVSMRGVLSRFWDNITIGNRTNSLTWQDTFRDRFDNYRASGEKLERVITMSSASLAVVSALPGLLVLYNSVLSSGNRNLMLVCIAVLPRFFQTIVMSDTFLEASLSLSSAWARVENAVTNVCDEWPDTGDHLEERVHSKKVTILQDGKKLASHHQLLASARNFEVGRATITGDNGSGKSTLLQILKADDGFESLYIPAHHTLDFPGLTVLDGRSTGQRRLDEMKIMARVAKEPVLLLDEWDANFDAVSRLEGERIISELSKTRLIIEVRHTVRSINLAGDGGSGT